MNISFFSLHFDFFSIIAKELNQEQCSMCYNLPCFLVLLCTHYGLLQCFSTYFQKLKEIGVLRPIFLDYVISCDYGVIEHTKTISLLLSTVFISFYYLITTCGNNNVGDRILLHKSVLKKYMSSNKFVIIIANDSSEL